MSDVRDELTIGKDIGCELLGVGGAYAIGRTRLIDVEAAVTPCIFLKHFASQEVILVFGPLGGTQLWVVLLGLEKVYLLLAGVGLKLVTDLLQYIALSIVLIFRKGSSTSRWLRTS